MKRMTPLELEMLIHVHTQGRYKTPLHPAYLEAAEKFEKLGLVKFTSERWMEITELGAAHLFQMLSLPFPTKGTIIKDASGSEINMKDDRFFHKYVS